MVTKSQKISYIFRKTRGLDYFSKRISDYIVAALLLSILWPIFISVAFAIKLDSPGNVFFRQTRIGLNGKHFKIWKFRTMVHNSEHLQKDLEAHNEIKGGIIFKIKNDPRMTRIGKFLRRFSLDEIPQLFNVLLGDMSIIGPRPLPLRDIEKMDSALQIRHKVLPGITGLAQVNGRSQCSSEEFFYWDKLYIQRWSLWLDLKIMLKTIPVVIAKKGAC